MNTFYSPMGHAGVQNSPKQDQGFGLTIKRLVYLLFLVLVSGLISEPVFAQTISYSGAITSYTVPSGVTSLKIETDGAQGGTSGSNAGGLGARMIGTFTVTPGQVLKVLVGGAGGAGTQGGGGGGTFVTDASNNPLCIAGGGGGGYYSTYSSGSGQSAGTTSTTAQNGMSGNSGAQCGAGGTASNGGGVCATNGVNTGAGGGGLTGNGAQNGAAVGGNSFTNGGAGGAAAGSGGAGGFGGGGGADWLSWTGGGGGGGYSGGGGGNYYGVGGGGGSYNGGTSQSNTSGANAGNGYAIFTPLSGAASQCWNSWASSGGTGGGGFSANSLSGSIAVPASGYTFWGGAAGGTFTFSASVGTGWSTPYISVYYLNTAGSAWIGLAGAASSVTFTTPTSGVYAGAAPYLVVVMNGGNAGSCSTSQPWPGANSSTLTYRKTNIPTTDGISVSSSCWNTDGAHSYTITAQSTLIGTDWGGSYGIMGLINYQGSNAPNYAGYLSWNPSLSNLSGSGYTTNQVTATGNAGGYAGIAGGGYTNGAITLTACSANISGNQVTVVWTVTPTTSFPKAGAINGISQYACDLGNDVTGWTLNQLNFASGYVSLSSPSPASQTVCQSAAIGAISTTATGGPATITYQWYSNASNNNTTGTPIGGATGASYTPPATATVGTTYYYCVSNSGAGCGAVPSATASVTVNANPTVNVGSAMAAICQGGTSAALGGSVGGGATGGTWSDGGAGGSFPGGATNLNTTYTAGAASGTPVTLTLTTSGGSCGTTSATKQIVVNPNPTVSAGAAMSAICQSGVSAALGGSVGGGATGGTWSDGGAGGSFPAGATNLNTTYQAGASSGSPVTLTLTTSGGSCGTTSATKQIVVNPNPTANAGAAMAAICQNGTSAALGGSVGGGATGGTWSDGGAGGSFPGGATNLNTTYKAGAASGSPVTLTLTTSGGSCGTTSATKQIVVNPNPTVNAGGAMAAICQGGTSAALGGSFGGGATSAVWSDGGAGGSFANNGGTTPSTATYTAGAASGTPVTLTLTTSGGSCGTTAATKQIVVNPNPTVNAGAAMAAICQNGTSAALGGSVGGGATGGTWSDGGAGGSFPGGATNLNTTYKAGAASGTPVTLTLTTSGGSCGTTSANKQIVVNPNPTVNTGAAMAAICQNGTSAALGGSVGGGATGGTWSDGGAGGSFPGGATNLNTTYKAGAASGTPVTLTLTTSGGSCGTTAATKQIVVNPNPTVNAGGAMAAICQGGTSAALGGSFGGGATSAVWSDGGAGGSFANNGGTTPSTATYTAGAASGSPVTLTLTTGGGSCGTTSANKQIVVNPNPTVNAGGAIAAICQGGTSAALGGSFGGGATSAIWSDGGAGGSFANNGGTTPATTTYTAGASSSSPVTLTLTTSGGSCGVTSANKQIVVNVLQVLTIPTAVCTNGTAALSSNISVNWSVNSGSVNNASGATTTFTPAAIGAPTQNQNVIVTATNGACVVNKSIRVDNLNSITTAPATVCNSATAAFGGNINGVIWTSSAGSMSGTGVSSTFTPQAITAPTANQNATITATNGVCTPATATIRVDNQNSITNAPSVLCDQSGNFFLSGNIAGVVWSVAMGNVTGSAVTSPGQNSTLTTGTVLGTNSNITVTATNGSCSTNDNIHLDHGVGSNAGADLEQCNTSTFTLSGNAPPVGTGTWTILSGPGTITAANNNNSTVTGVTAGSITTLNWALTNGSCLSSSQVHLQNDATPTASSAGADQVNCLNGTFTLAGTQPTVGTGQWSVVTGTCTITSPAAYNSTVTGVPNGTSVVLKWTISNGLCATASQVLLTNTLVTPPVIAETDALCFGANNGIVTVTTPSGGGFSPYQYSIDGINYQPGLSFTGLAAPANYSVKGKDVNGCVSVPSNTVTVSQPSVLNAATITGTNISCNGASDGTITVSVISSGGTSPYQYSLDGINYQPGLSFTGLGPNTYSVTTRDGNGCISAASNPITITQPAVLRSPSITHANVTCFGAANGTVTVFITPGGGTAPYQYSLNGGTYQSSTSFTGLVPGNYTVTAKDAHNCTSTSNTVTVTQPAAALATAAIVGTNVTCNGFSNGVVTVSPLPTGGTPPYLYSFNGGGYSANTSYPGLAPGTYAVTVEDAHGCSFVTNSVTITQPNTLTLSASNGGPYSVTQTIALSTIVAGGTTNYSYHWSGPALFSSNSANPTIPNATPLNAGAYNVTVTDANGCTASASTTVVVNPTIGYTWTGTTSTDWTISTNWFPAITGGPNSCSADVLIPLTANMPTIPSPVQVASIQINSGVTVTANADLSICRNLTGGGSGINAIVSGSGLVIMDGSILQTISSAVKIDELRLDNPAGAQILATSSVQLVTSLDLKNGNFDATNGSLTFLSTSTTQIAILDNFSTGYHGTITGNIHAQRYYNAPTTANSYTQHFTGSPVNSPAFSQLGAAGTAGYLIATTTCDESRIAVGSPYSTVLALDETHGATCTTNQWIAEIGGTAQNGRGYAVGRAAGPGIISLTGTANLNTSYQVPNLTNSNWTNGTLQGHTINSGWHLVSNPYLATLNVQTNADNSDFDNQIQVWNTYGPNAGSFTQYLTSNNAIVAPFQGFMVHKTVNGGTSTYNLHASDRVRTAHAFYRANDNDLKITAENQTTHLLDQTEVAFNTAATDQFDPRYDANKPSGSLNRHTLYSVNNGKWMGINVLHDIAQTSTVDVGFEPGNTATYNFSFTGVSTFDPTSYVYLEDKVLHIMHDVRSGDYSFTADSADAWDRFVLHFTPPAIMAITDAGCTTQGVINVTQPGTASWNYTLTNSNNQNIASGTLNQNNPLQVSAPAGTYTLTLTDNNNYTATEQLQVNGPDAITASFSSPTAVQEGQNVVLTSTTPNATSYQWNLGNGQTATGATVNYSYPTAGTYTVVLTATNLSGCTSTASQTITVNANATGINNLNDKNGIGIWSNENKVYVDFRNLQKVDAVIAIYNVLGQEISNEKFKTNMLYQKEIGSIEAAYLVVSVKIDDKVVTKKVFVTNLK